MDNCPQWFTWFFDGIGTQLLALIIGAIGGGIAGYRIGVKKYEGQEQVAGSKAKQHQELTVNEDDTKAKKSSVESKMIQKQKAGDEAKQIQIGSVKRGK